MNPMPDTDRLFHKLESTLVKKRLVMFTTGLFVTLTMAVLISLTLSVVASIAVLPVAVKVTLLIISALIILAVFSWLALRGALTGDVESVAAALEKKYPELKGRLIAAIQFARMKSTPGYSSDLMAVTQSQAAGKADEINFNSAAPLYPLYKTLRFMTPVLAITMALVIIAPGMFDYSLRVYSNPLSVVAPPLGYTLTAVPGSVQWVKYENIDIGGALIGDKFPAKAVINHRLAGGSWQKSEIDIAKQLRHPLERGDSVTFAITLRQINKSFDYYIEAGRLRTPMQSVDVVDLPRVTGIKLSLFYPEYTGLPPTVIDENNGSFSAVVGSRVNMRVSTNRPMRVAQLVFRNSSRVPLAIENAAASATLKVDSSRSYFIHLEDNLGESNPDPIEYYITAIPDEYPSIDVVRPGFDVNLNDDMALPLKVNIFDDYGFSSLVLKYTVVSQGRQSEENVAVLHFSERIKTEGEIEFNWDLNRLNLFPGDYVIYYFEVADNDRISGPKVTATRRYVARLPSLDEIIAQAEQESAGRIIDTENILRSGKDLSERLKNVARKLQAQNNQLEQADWQHQKELQNLVDKNEEMVEQIENLAESMEKSLEELNDKALLSREILEKLMQVQQLFEDVATPEMKDAQRRLMEALQKMDPTQLQQAIKDFQMSQEELLQRLERTLTLLKRMQLEQVMESMLRTAEEIARKQEEVNKRTDESSSEKLPELSEDEKQLNEALDELQKKVGELDELARQAAMEQSRELQKFKQAVSENDAGLHMEKMTDALKQENKAESSEQGNKALGKLMEMIDGMQQPMLAMQGRHNERVEKQMRMALQDANNLSQMQERLLGEATEVGPQSMVLRDLAARQQGLAGSVSALQNQIEELGKQSPFIAGELRRIIGEAAGNMTMAIQQFDAKRGQQAASQQKEAMFHLNRASLRLLESLNQMQQSQSGGNCDQGTSMLQGLSDQQNQLNQRTQQQLGSSGANIPMDNSSAGRQMLQRLAGEQGTIRKSMEDLSREFAGSRQILGRLDDIAKEMREVEEALSSGQVGGDLVERQVKIYSRMLEATRSLYRKDFSEQRQAKTATNPTFHVPPELSREIFDDRMKLEDRLRQYLGGSYPPQYEEQIKAYFRALLQAESERIRLDDAASTPPEEQK